MPTIIALDVSLSMQRPIPGRSEDNVLTYQQLAAKGISQLLEHLAISKLEYVALITYSTACEVKVDFTRDYELLRQAVKKVEPGDKLCLISMLKSVGGILATNWGRQNCSQVVVFTDCGLGFGSTALQGFLLEYVAKRLDPDYAWLATLKPVKFSFICMGVHSDNYFKRAIPVYQQFFDMTALKGKLYMTKTAKDSTTEGTDSGASDGNCNVAVSAAATSAAAIVTTTGHSNNNSSELGRKAMFEIIEQLCEATYKPYEAILKVGGYHRLECAVHIWPPPAPYQSESELVPRTIAHRLEVCGYLALSEIGSPASLSRHLILPKVERVEKPNCRSADKSSPSPKATNSSGGKRPVSDVILSEKLEQDIRDFYMRDPKDTDDSGDDAEATKVSNSVSHSSTEAQKESMCVLLHGALKMEGLAALVLLSDNWYGFLYSHADSKKKSNLMLNILPPGSHVIPWLGDLKMLGFVEDLVPGEATSFPVKSEKRSYSQSCVVWIRHASLQSDIQKVLRHAKKMPEKTPHFYKELNRIRRAALSIGFVELLEAMAILFEKECAQLLPNASAEGALQLKHAAVELRRPSNRDIKVSIMPVQKFGAGGGAAGAVTGVVGVLPSLLRSGL